MIIKTKQKKGYNYDYDYIRETNISQNIRRTLSCLLTSIFEFSFRHFDWLTSIRIWRAKPPFLDSIDSIPVMLRSLSSRRSLYPCLSFVCNRLASTSRFPSEKLTQSYFHHASDIPLFYHTIGQHLDYLAAEHPNHQCYSFKGEGNKNYTYKSFLDEVDSLASSLIELGFEKNDRLAVWLPNTSENCALSYAASKVGVIKVERTDDWATNDALPLGEYQSGLHGSRIGLLSE